VHLFFGKTDFCFGKQNHNLGILCRLVFLLGEPENKTLTQPLLEQESLEYGDIVQVSSFTQPPLEQESLDHRDIVQVSSFTQPLLEQEWSMET